MTGVMSSGKFVKLQNCRCLRFPEQEFLPIPPSLVQVAGKNTTEAQDEGQGAGQLSLVTTPSLGKALWHTFQIYLILGAQNRSSLEFTSILIKNKFHCTQMKHALLFKQIPLGVFSFKFIGIV